MCFSSFYFLSTQRPLCHPGLWDSHLIRAPSAILSPSPHGSQSRDFHVTVLQKPPQWSPVVLGQRPIIPPPWPRSPSGSGPTDFHLIPPRSSDPHCSQLSFSQFLLLCSDKLGSGLGAAPSDWMLGTPSFYYCCSPSARLALK